MDEVIEKANRTQYGLAAAVHTKDIERALTVAHSIRAGMLWFVFPDVFCCFSLPYFVIKSCKIKNMEDFNLNSITETNEMFF